MGSFILLMGAGASVPAGIPQATKFVEALEEYLLKKEEKEEELVEAFKYVLSSLHGQVIDIELLLTTLGELPKDTPKAFFCPILEYYAKKVIRERCSFVSPNDVRYLVPLIKLFLSYIPTLDIFTLNYDPCIEIVCDDLEIRCIDGFDSTWSPPLFEQEGTSNDPIIRLYKLHGSILWYKRLNHSKFRFVKIPVFPLTQRYRYFTQEAVSEVMIYPEKDKDISSDIFGALLQMFRKRLNEVSICIAIGYSFRDEHIKGCVEETMYSNDSLEIVIVNPNAENIRQNFSKELKNRIKSIPKRIKDLNLLEELMQILGNKSFYKDNSKKISNVTQKASVGCWGVAVNPNNTNIALITQSAFKSYTTGVIYQVDMSTTPWNYSQIRTEPELEGPRYIIFEKENTALVTEFLVNGREGKGRISRINLLPVQGKYKVEPIVSGLKWPVGIALTYDPDIVLITEATQLCQLHLTKKEITRLHPANRTHFFNLFGVVIEEPDTIILLESGIWRDNGIGQLLRMNLKSREITFIRLLEFPYASGLAMDRKNKTIFITQASSQGKVLKVDLKNNAITSIAEGLNNPSMITIVNDGTEAIVSTHDGLRKISLGSGKGS